MKRLFTALAIGAGVVYLIGLMGATMLMAYATSHALEVGDFPRARLGIAMIAFAIGHPTLITCLVLYKRRP